MHIDYKVKGGKLLRIDIEIEKETIKDIRIAGDFFMYPEEFILELEKTLIGMPLVRERIEDKLRKAAKESNVKMIGISIEDIVNAILRAQRG